MRKKSVPVSKRFGDVIHVWDAMFTTNYYYVIAPSFAKYLEIVKRRFNVNLPNKEHEPEGNTTSCFREGSGYLTFIWTRDHSVDTIAHECFHAISGDFEQKGVKLSNESNELYAYAIQFLIREILKHLKGAKR